MTDRPILFSAPMIRALLAGRKTQTRRLIKFAGIGNVIEFQKVATDPQGRPVYEMRDGAGKHYARPAAPGFVDYHYSTPIGFGDRLWARETYLPDPPSDDPSWHDNVCSYVEWSGCGSRVSDVPRPLQDGAFCIYRADPKWDEDPMAWRPSIHMPRWASRLTLIVTDVRVERLQAISEEDAVAEGALPYHISASGLDYYGPSHAMCGQDHRAGFCKIWETINGIESWDANSWVAAYTFTVHHHNIDKMEIARG